MRKSRFSEERIIGVLKEHKGLPVAEIGRRQGPVTRRSTLGVRSTAG
jgi:hypothetical protein